VSSDHLDEDDLSEHLKRVWEAMAELDREVERLRLSGQAATPQTGTKAAKPSPRARASSRRMA
jgi:hypothetical protein